ncbi:MAG: stage II sporulation protein M [Planctomycetes bacterium]|nr:stage II sporulation protein M [Planctomycetota bacterium]
MAVMPHHQISQVATRAMDRWRFLAFEGLTWSKVRARPQRLDIVENFTATYRRTATELARVRAFSPDKRLADYIEQAVATAHFAVYRRKRPTIRQMVTGALFAVPRATRALWKYHALSLGITIVTTAISFIAVMYAPETFYLFIDRSLAGGRDPSASRDFLAEGLGPQPTTAGQDVFFSTFLFTHNTQVAFMCFAWGIFLGLPTLYLLIRNGLMLGAFLGLFFSKGLGPEAVAWLGPHGVPEMGAIILCGGAGLAIGHRVLNPGSKSRKEAIQKTATNASIVGMGCVLLLAMAGVIEGSFRQSRATLEMRFALIGVMLIICVGWLFFVKARGADETS